MAKVDWQIIEEMDLDDGTHTCYASTDNAGANSRYIWLTLFSDGWHVELSNSKIGEPYTGITTKAVCRSLLSAKRYAKRYLICD